MSLDRWQAERRDKVLTTEAFLNEKIRQCNDSIWRHERDGTQKKLSIDRKNNDSKQTQIRIDEITLAFYTAAKKEHRMVNAKIFAEIEAERNKDNEVIRA